MKRIFGLMTMVFAIGMFIACDNGTAGEGSSDSNNNNYDPYALNIATLTEWANDPARKISAGGGGAQPINEAARNNFIAAAPGLWGATSATYRNDHATYARMMVSFAESAGLPPPVIITKGKQFDASAISTIAVKNPLVSI